MLDRNQTNDRNVQDDQLNAKEPSEIDQAPKQDINKVNLEPQQGKNRADGDLPSESDRPMEKQ